MMIKENINLPTLWEPISKYEQDCIIKEYEINHNTAEVGRKFNRPTTSILRVLKRKEIDTTRKIRKYTLDENYFDIIDTEEKAYFLGLLYADGSNCTERHSVTLAIQTKDEEILNKFSIAIKSNRPIRILEKNKDNPNLQDICIFSINSKRISEKLVKLGCLNNKTFLLKFPTEDQVPSNLVQHFVRGYFDGDGCCSIMITNKHNRVQALSSIVSTEDFCNDVISILKKEININCSLQKRHKDRDTNNRTIHIPGLRQSQKFLEWLYKDATIYFERKYEKLKLIYKIDEIKSKYKLRNSLEIKAKLIKELENVIYPNGRSIKND